MSFFTEGGNPRHASLSYEYADIHYFWIGANLQQPRGNSILALDFMYDDLDPSSKRFSAEIKSRLLARQYDWSRIAAVLIDEPYLARIASDTSIHSWTRPCTRRLDLRSASVARTAALLRKMAAVVKELSPTTLFWVNFSEPEMQWMRAGGACGHSIYARYLDVISLDKYQVPFDNGGDFPRDGQEGSSVRPYYDWLIYKRLAPHQKVALVPGVFHVVPRNAGRSTDPNATAERLAGFFDYADRTNSDCTVDPSLRHGRDKRCVVWLVAGFRAGVVHHAEEDWAGLFETSADPIVLRWKAELNKPRATQLR